MSIETGLPASLSCMDGASDLYNYLTVFSPKDNTWDRLKVQSLLLAKAYERIDYERYAERISQCSPFLQFKQIVDPESGELKLKLSHAEFCRVRLCPVCQWRKAMAWFARFAKALPQIRQKYPTSEFIFLTLTVRNCPVEELRSTLRWMSKSWGRLVKLKAWPAQGFARSVEVTRSEIGEAHPHYHVLMMVNRSYFKGQRYLSQKKWIELWRKSLRVDYDPNVDVRKVRSKNNQGDLYAAISETFKYSVKTGDVLINDYWIEQVTKQLDKTRSISLGGVFKQYMSEEEPEDLIGSADEDESGETITFGWNEQINHYTM